VARLLASGDLSPVELTRSVLERIDRINPRLETYVSVFHEEALAAAQLATDEIVVRGSRGPLHGIPIAIKDLYDVLGKPTLAGSRVREGSTTMKRAAGALSVGVVFRHAALE